MVAGEEQDMTDREMLELAAKAAEIEWVDGHENAGLRNRDGRVWNPLVSDGDALRLAVKLKIGSIEALRLWASVDCEAANSAYEIDPYAATRRAIVRAAAEIGRNT
jgi:hypothetical protein